MTKAQNRVTLLQMFSLGWNGSLCGTVGQERWKTFKRQQSWLLWRPKSTSPPHANDSIFHLQPLTQQKLQIKESFWKDRAIWTAHFGKDIVRIECDGMNFPTGSKILSFREQLPFNRKAASLCAVGRFSPGLSSLKHQHGVWYSTLVIQIQSSQGCTA